MDKLVSFALPLMASSILQLMFNAVDIIVVGHFNGREALAAVGSTTALINIFTNLFIGISLGANVLAARYQATGRTKEMSEAVHTAITLALVSGILMAVVGVLLSRRALELMATPANVIGQSALYMKIYFCGMPFFMLYNYGAAILRAVGDTKRPLLYLIVAGLTNVVLGPSSGHRDPAWRCGRGDRYGELPDGILHPGAPVPVPVRGAYQLRFSKLTIKWIYLKHIFCSGDTGRHPEYGHQFLQCHAPVFRELFRGYGDGGIHGGQ